MHCDFHTIPIVTSKNMNINSEYFFPKCTLYKRDCIFNFSKLRKYLSTKALFIDRNNPSEGKQKQVCTKALYLSYWLIEEISTTYEDIWDDEGWMCRMFYFLYGYVSYRVSREHNTRASVLETCYWKDNCAHSEKNGRDLGLLANK